MAQIPNIAALTIGAEEVRDLRETIARAIYQDENFLKYHNVVDGITKKTQIVLDGTSGMAGWKATGCAAVSSGGMDIKMTEKFWETVTIEDAISYCQADLDVNFKPLVLRNSKEKFGFLADQEAINIFVSASVERFLKEAVERFIWLGDTQATNTSDSGKVVDTWDIRYFTAMDGFWKQIMTSVTAGDTPHINVTMNEQTTKALQLSTLTDAAAFAIVKGVYDNAPDALKLDPTAYIRVTTRVYNGYKNYITSGEFANGGFSEKVINGLSTVAYQGVPIYTSLFESKEILDKFEVSDGGLPAVMTYDFPHRAVMATPDLLPIATINMEDMSNLEAFYDQITRKSFIRFDVDLDAKLVRPDMISVAY